MSVSPKVTALTLVIVGCAGQGDLAPSDGGTGADTGLHHQQLDRCGNGLDDDGNGRIDDGCPCGPGETQRCYEGELSNRGAGLCSDGVQTCTTTTEWGDWGDNECQGSVLPGDEICDGKDDDCDGAIDEGCPCESGASQECGVEFLVEPCRGGAQVCSADGTWSSCEGAVGPEAEQCGADGLGNGVDEDCNGVVDDLCGCVPEAEQCRDGIDNDCDGIVDELECRPDWPPTDCDPSLVAPRLIAPLSTSRVTSNQPTFHWELPPGASEGVVELCSSADCGTPFETIRGGTDASPTAPLSSGATFFRVRTQGAVDPSCATSPTWEIFVGARDAGLDTVQGFNLDINRDGNPDFLVGARWIVDGSYTPMVFEAVHGRDGSFPDGTTNQTLEGPGPIASARSVGDLDGDGFGDVVVHVGGATDRSCEVRRGTPAGLEASASATFLNCRNVSGLGDFDGDGYGDLVVLSAGGGASGSRPPRLVFGSPTLSAPAEVPHNLAIANGWGYAHRGGDLNGDGLGDVVIEYIRKVRTPTHINIFTPTVFYGNASRTWGPATSLGDLEPVGLAIPDQFAAGDVNGDGYGDLIIALPVDQNRIYHGGPTGVAMVPATFSTTASGMTERVGDFDGDGFEDFLVHGELYRGSASGLVTTAVWTLPASSWLAGVGDLNGDGYEDAVLESGASGATGISAMPGMVGGFGSGTAVPLLASSSGEPAGGRALDGIAND